jgi:hypothetical protein
MARGRAGGARVAAARQHLLPDARIVGGEVSWCALSRYQGDPSPSSRVLSSKRISGQSPCARTSRILQEVMKTGDTRVGHPMFPLTLTRSTEHRQENPVVGAGQSGEGLGDKARKR